MTLEERKAALVKEHGILAQQLGQMQAQINRIATQLQRIEGQLALVEELLKEKTREEVVYINFEDERIPPKKEILGSLLPTAQLYTKKDIAYLFLDEIQILDPANRHAILDTARKLGFIAITAAPEAVSEVDSLYFLQPRKGSIVLRQKHRVGIKPRPVAA